MTRKERLFAIREILSASHVSSQEELRRRLLRRGCRVTQATLSRDMTALGVVRVSSREGGQYTIPPPTELQSLKPVVGIEVVSIRANEQTIIIRTLPAAAGTVAEYIDELQDSDILGTVAGDNTVLVIPRTVRRTSHIAGMLKRKLIKGG
jgi:transcriptional regulator of arginine metabolism